MKQVSLAKWIAPYRGALRRKALDATFKGIAAVVEQLPRTRRRRAAFRLHEGLVYARRDGRTLRLDVMQPPPSVPRPVVVYIHGGGFTTCSRVTHRAVASVFAAHGHLVFNLDYRLAPDAPFPAALDDVCTAWQWIATRIARYGGDASRVFIAGESAGANLALALLLATGGDRPEAWAATARAAGPRPAGALLFSGFLQASHPERYRREGVSALGANIARDAARAYLGANAGHPLPEQALADPLCVVEAMTTAPNLPPIFIAVGTADPVAQDSERLDAALTRLGASHVYRRYPGETHVFHLMPWRPAALRCWADSFAFLAAAKSVRHDESHLA